MIVADMPEAMRPLAMLPEMVMYGGGLVVLLSGSFLPRRRLWVARLLAAGAVTAATVLATIAMAAGPAWAFTGTFAVDTGTGAARITAGLGTLLVLAMAGDEVAGSPRESEVCALLLFSTAGAMVMAGAADLLVLVGGFLLASIPLYALIGLVGTAPGAEAAMKTYLIGSLFGILLLLGVTVLYGVGGTTAYAGLATALGAAPRAAVAAGLVAVIAGLMFKAGAVPAHFWVPDAAQGTTATVAAFLTSIPKIGALVAAYRLVSSVPDTVQWPLLVAALATASMTLGNLAAYWQDDPRRLLGWSTVSQVGYLLVPVAVAGRSDLALPSLLVYIGGYTATNIAAFAVTAALPDQRTLASYRGVAGARPWLAGALLVALLGLVGTPPTVVFVGKLTTASAAWDGGYAWLALVVLANSVISLFYYLRWLAPAFRPREEGAPPTAGQWCTGTAVGAAVVSLVLGVGSGLVWAAVDGPLLG